MKTFRKKHLKKTFRKKHLKKTFRNKRMKGGFTIEKRSNEHGDTWEEVAFTEEEKKQIKKLGETELNSVKIRDTLFPNIPDQNKNNAAYVIRNIAYKWQGA